MLPPEFTSDPGRAKRFQSSTGRLAQLDAQRQRLFARRVPFHVSFLDDIALGILPTDLVVVGAETGAGKTTLGTLFALSSATKGLRVSYVALEAYQSEIEQRLLYQRVSTLAWKQHLEGRHQLSYARWMHGKCEEVHRQVADDARMELATDLETLRTYYREREFKPEHIVPLLSSVAESTDLFVFDHLHYVDTDDRDENRAMGAVVKLLADFVNTAEKPVIAVAHLRKKDRGQRRDQLVPDLHEFHGASAITKIATKVVMLAPARDRPSESHIANTYMAVEKDRLAGKSPYVAAIGFDMRTAGYEKRYELGRLSPDRGEFIALHSLEKPPWAEHGICTGKLP